jgi:hypothetical protein
MSEIDYGAVFGIDTGANEPATAQQDAGTTDAENTANTDTGSETENDAGVKETEPAEQSAEENAKYANIRRKAEAEAKQAAQRSLDEAIASMGQTNPYTGKAVTTKAEWDAWKAQEAQEKRKEVAESAGMSETEFDNFVQNLPSVRDYRQAAEKLRQDDQKRMLADQITEIGKLDPSIKTVEDLVKRPEYRQIYAKLQNNRDLSVVEAFKLVNYETLTQNAAAASRQAALNAAASKDHMAPTQTRGSGAITVPADVKNMYRLYNPEATDAEIQAHYAKFHKN